MRESPDASVIGASRLAAAAIGETLPSVAGDTPAAIEPLPDAVDQIGEAWRRWKSRWIS